jgi:hypothetical protein
VFATRLCKRQGEIFAAMLCLGSNVGALSDVEVLVSMMDESSGGHPSVLLVRAHLCIARGAVLEARDMLSRCDARHPGDAGVKAMLALCHYILRDATWRFFAEGVAGLPPDPAARAIVDWIRLVSDGSTTDERSRPATAPCDGAAFEPSGGMLC